MIEQNTVLSLPPSGPPPTSTLALKWYAGALVGLVFAVVAHEVKPENTAVEVAFWTSVAAGGLCVLHMAGRVAWRSFINRIDKDMSKVRRSRDRLWRQTVRAGVDLHPGPHGAVPSPSVPTPPPASPVPKTSEGEPRINHR
ncbi:hypothetical protein [Streptomyces sp. CC228A]|uniref:hypothetical protein n=1 Tax=Streptomyces sp. CC228A TaxID=2898186 RepID=UPI001F3B98E6|nr:hypothetical protein [Streptomyces sp. CC228A]